jgi:hypothetical protein
MGTMQIFSSIDIAVTAEQLWDEITRFDRWHEWNPFIFQMKILGGDAAVLKEVEIGFRDEKSPRYVRGTISRLVQSEQLVIVRGNFV